METLILICLVIVIILLLENNIPIRKRSGEKKVPYELPVIELDIMGRNNTVSRQVVPKAAEEGHHEDSESEADNFENEIDERQVEIQIPQEELDDAYGEGVNLREEEEEWSGYGNGISGDENGFATGVTFEELSTVEMLLQQKVLEPSQTETAVRIVQKIQGTELFSLLESSMEGASKRMAELLDRSLSGVADSGSSIMRKSDMENFDISEFI